MSISLTEKLTQFSQTAEKLKDMSDDLRRHHAEDLNNVEWIDIELNNLVELIRQLKVDYDMSERSHNG
jgi:hypothetical protein